MTIETIREKLLISITEDQEWVNVLNHTEPGHHGVEDWDVYLEDKDLWVDLGSRTFSFKNAKFDFVVILGDSNDGINVDATKVAKGKGAFSFSSDRDGIVIDEMLIDVDLDIMA
ncbi:MAG: hypothetical protein RLZZ367_1531 [Bacteroidota bacterium]|jgi:hypothetical protein